MTSQHEAERMKGIPFSSIRAVFEKVSELQSKGKYSIPFHIGRPDFDTPQHIKDAAKTALDEGLTSYTSNYGLLELRNAIAEKLHNDNDVSVDPEGEIIVTVGANEAVLLAMMAFLNPGDEVIIPDPMWLHYFYCASLAGAQVISVPLLAKNQFQLDPEDLKKLITPNTKMIVINSPHNPTGSIFRAENIKAIADIVEKHNLLVLSDEIYEKLVYSDTPVISPGSIESISERTLTINGFSKSYAMTGWRLGYIAASKNLIESMIRVHQYTTVCATSFAQAGAIAALRGSQNCVDEMVAEFDRRRQVIVDGFNEIGEDVLVEPAGAFYAFPDIRRLNASSEVIAQRLLDEAGVAVINGKAFGKYGDGYFRISYACSIDDVKSGMNSISDFWQKND